MRQQANATRWIWAIVLIATSACSSPTPGPTPLPPDKLNIVTVQSELMTRLNAARAARGLGRITSNDALHKLAEQRALDIVEGRTDFDLVDDALANQLGQPVAELRIYLCGGAFTSAAVGEEAMRQWAGTPELDEAMMGNWRLAGVGFAFGCPVEVEGIALVVILAGKSPFFTG